MFLPKINKMKGKLIKSVATLALMGSLVSCNIAEDLERKAKNEQFLIRTSELANILHQKEKKLTNNSHFKIYSEITGGHYRPIKGLERRLAQGFINPKDITLKKADLNNNGMIEWYINHNGHNYMLGTNGDELRLVILNPSAINKTINSLEKSIFDEGRIEFFNRGYEQTKKEKVDIYHMMEYGFVHPNQIRFNFNSNNNKTNNADLKWEIVYTGDFLSFNPKEKNYRFTENEKGELELIPK